MVMNQVTMNPPVLVTYSQIEGLWFHVVYIMRYVIRIKKHLHKWNRNSRNRKAVIEIKLNRKEYELLHPCS